MAGSGVAPPTFSTHEPAKAKALLKSLGQDEAQVYEWRAPDGAGENALSITALATGWAYPGGGYVMIFPHSNSSKAEKMSARLEAGQFLNLNTRAIFVEFTTYNPQERMFTIHSIAMEQTTTGSFLKHSHIVTFPLASYQYV